MKTQLKTFKSMGMKNFYRYLIAIVIAGLCVLPEHQALAGNKDRSGQAGANELLINPWAKSSGWGGINTSSVKGLDAMFVNVAGIAHTKSTELNFSHTTWLKGSDINIAAFGFLQRVGEQGVLGMSITSMSAGDIEYTRPELPEGGIGTFSPSLMNVAISYARAFSNSIYGGFTIRIINESIADISAGGVALDAGIQYITGEDENIKFGITLKNIGPRMSFNGDGFIEKVQRQDDINGEYAMLTPAAEFEMPTTLAMGASYDFLFTKNRLTLAGNFQSNAFTNDQFGVGAEYSYQDYVMLRAGYVYEDGISNDIESYERYTAASGFNAGISIQAPLNKEKGSSIGIDYSYRPTAHFDGTHSIGVRISL